MEKEEVASIKKLFRSRDFNKISEGIEIVQRIANPEVFDELLGKVEYSFDKWSGSFSHDWKGAGPDEHYFQTAILGLLNYAPKGSKGYEIRESVKILRIRGEITSGYSNTNSAIYVNYLSNFLNLEYLKLERFKEVVGFEDIYHLPIRGLELKLLDKLPNQSQRWGFKDIRTLHFTMPKVEILNHIDFLTDLKTLENLKIDGGFIENSTDFSMRGLGNLSNIKYLKTNSLGYIGTDDFVNLKDLNYLAIREGNLQDISGLSTLTNLEFIDFSGCNKLNDLRQLNPLKEIRIINISYTGVSSLNGLENCMNLNAINISNTEIENLNPLKNAKSLYGVNANYCKNLVSIEGLSNSSVLREVLLEDCTSLLSLTGLESCEQLRIISISKSAVRNLDPLQNCSKLFNNCSIKWDEEVAEWNGNTGDQHNPFNGITEVVSNVGYGNLYQAKYTSAEYREYYPNRDWKEPELNEFVIRSCPNIDSVEGLKNSAIQILIVNDCPSLTSIDYISQFPLLQCCDFSSCINLESVKGLGQLNLMDRLILKKCTKIKPKPRFLVMDSLEKTLNYLGKFRVLQSSLELSDAEKDIIKKLEKLLLADNYKNIELGLELAYSISQPAIFNYLLQGVKFTNNQIIPNNRFLGNEVTKVYREFALEGLISVAPSTCELANNVKKAITEKVVSGSHYSSLLSVLGYTELEKLTIKGTSITIVADLNRLKKLKSLLLDNNPNLKDLSGISGLDSLESIGISKCSSIVDLNYVSGFKSLSSAQINDCGVISSKGLCDLPKIKNINLNDNKSLEVVDELGDLTSLEVITLNGCGSLKSLKPLAKLNNLSFLKIDNHNLSDLDGVSGLILPLLEGLRK